MNSDDHDCAKMEEDFAYQREENTTLRARVEELEATCASQREALERLESYTRRWVANSPELQQAREALSPTAGSELLAKLAAQREALYWIVDAVDRGELAYWKREDYAAARAALASTPSTAEWLEGVRREAKREERIACIDAIERRAAKYFMQHGENAGISVATDAINALGAFEDEEMER
jgi:hypothetical protein